MRVEGSDVAVKSFGIIVVFLGVELDKRRGVLGGDISVGVSRERDV